MLDFNIQNGAVVEELPLVSSLIYEHPTATSVSINGLDLSEDGNRIIYSMEQASSGGWLNSLNEIDVSNCSAACGSSRFYSALDIGIHDVSITGNRVYSDLHERIPDIHSVSFLENQNGTWSSPKYVVTDADLGSRGFTAVEAGAWDHDGNGSANPVLAISVEHFSGGLPTIDVLDVSVCSASGSLSCYAEGNAPTIRSNMDGYSQSFSGSDLLVGKNGAGPNADICLIDLDTVNYNCDLSFGDLPDSAE
jgi:hypothetical protein